MKFSNKDFYMVYGKHDEIVACGTISECCTMLDIKRDSFLKALKRQERSEGSERKIYKMEDDENGIYGNI